MRIRIKPLICVMLCLAVVFASHTILSTHSRYVLDGVGELLRSIITGPKLTVTFKNGDEIEISKINWLLIFKLILIYLLLYYFS